MDRRAFLTASTGALASLPFARAAQAGSGGVEPADSGSVNQVDVYLDTDDRRFQRSGYALRLRRVEERRRQLAGESPGGA